MLQHLRKAIAAEAVFVRSCAPTQNLLLRVFPLLWRQGFSFFCFFDFAYIDLRAWLIRSLTIIAIAPLALILALTDEPSYFVHIFPQSGVSLPTSQHKKQPNADTDDSEYDPT